MMKKNTVNLKDKSYPILIQRGLLNQVGQYLEGHRKVMIVTDEGVPEEYARRVLAQCGQGYVERVIQGEGAKSMEVYQQILRRMLKERFSRKDLIVALGGGVIGDLSGFVAATYMRGIEFINIPTTTLSQIDSSIGGKVAINLDGIKNCVGAFWQPKMVLIDPDVLATLPQRHINNGLVEALKAGLIRDESLFELFETDDPMEHIEKILYKSLMMKKKVVEIDEREIGVRRILNFGHTIGHGIESYYHLHDVYHGEAVALGMMKMIKDETIRDRLHPIYQRLNLKEDIDYDRQQVYDFITKDKKIDGGTLTIVLLRKIGEAYLKDIPTEKIKEYL